MDRPSTQAVLDAIPSIPHSSNEPVFREPWEAEAFAMVLALHEAGLFEWPEWAALLSKSITSAQAQGDPDLGNTYYLHWLSALEQLVVGKGVGNENILQNVATAWRDAAETTPHGEPIELSQQTLTQLMK